MINLSQIETRAKSDINKQKTERKTRDLVGRIGDLQHLLYAQGKQSLLVVLQGMDASGKDGTVKTVFANCNPTGIDVYGFKKPTEEEFARDFLWRVHKVVPKDGNIMVFNRSHYEDILIQRVHKWIDEEKVQKRMQAINSFENILEFDNNTKVLKIYLHISEERQLEKLQERIDDPTKRWKHNDGDWEERKHWAEYMKCYEYAINESKIPFHVIPSDQRWYRNYLIAQLVHKTLVDMNPTLSE